MKIDHANIGNVLEHVYFSATVTGVDGSNDTVNFIGIAPCPNGEDIPLFYHCTPDSELRDNGALEGAAGAFNVNDEVIVQCEIRSAENYNPLRVIGFVDKPKSCERYYIYVTISNYVIIWSLKTGEIADNIRDSYDNLITFPCHKNKLVKWLEGVKDKPTRQVLKDESENNRDYLSDNHKDIGNENRVELANENDPSYNYYFGVLSSCIFTNTVQDIHIDTDPTYPYTYPRKVYDLIEKDTPYPISIVGCELIDCNKSFSAGIDGTCYNPPNGYYKNGRANSVKYFEPYQPRSKMLYLGSYPSPTYLRSGSPPKEIEYSIPINSPYLYPVIMKSSAASFNCADYYGSDDWGLSHTIRNGYTASFSTVLGNLIVNYNSVRDLPDESDSLYDALRQGFDFEGNCFDIFLREGVCHALLKWERMGCMWESGGSPEYATELLNWCWNEALSVLDQRESESNRFGITWCGSPYDYRNSPEGQKDGWYRVLLRFYMGGFHTGGHSCLQNCNWSEQYCPNITGCEATSGCTCEATEWENELKERFSYVQPTIELEKPEDYPKAINTTKYERPKDYNTDSEGIGFCTEKKYSALCAFPGRSQGYDEKNGECFPFDGTYVLHTLGEAVEELINNHYEDGTDDQLITYLLKR